jgi:hypothetical protein
MAMRCRTLFVLILLLLNLLTLYLLATQMLAGSEASSGATGSGGGGGGGARSAAASAAVGASPATPAPPAAGSAAASTVQALEAVLSQYGSRLPREAWLARARREAGAPQPPVFFLTSARSGGVQSPGVVAKREEQYASNLGGILALGYQVFLSVAPTGGRKWELVEALAAAAAPGQLRVHYCTNATRVSARTAGPDETLCMQEAIETLFGGCLVPGSAPAQLLPAAPCGCPHAETHVVKMSGRYFLAKFHLLHAIWQRGAAVDAFFKWGPRWTESQAVDFPQAYTFYFSMKVRRGLCLGRARQCAPAPPLPALACAWRAAHAPSPSPLISNHAQFRSFIDCHMNWLTAAGDDGRRGEHPSVWRFSIELLTGRCISALPAHEELPELGIMANVANGPTYEYF